MSVINGLYYQHLRSSVGFTATGSLFYATLPWHPQSTIDEIRITNTAGTAFTVTNLVIVNSGAHYRNSSTDGKGHIIYRDPTDKNATSNEGFWASYLFNTVIFHENLYDRPFLNILVNLSESKTNYPMRITATGKKAVPTSYVKADSTGVEKFKVDNTGAVTSNSKSLALTEDVDKKLAIKDKLIEKLSARLDKLEKKLK